MLNEQLEETFLFNGFCARVKLAFPAKALDNFPCNVRNSDNVVPLTGDLSTGSDVKSGDDCGDRNFGEMPTESTALNLWSDCWLNSWSCSASGLLRGQSAERERGGDLGDDNIDVGTDSSAFSTTNAMNVFLHVA